MLSQDSIVLFHLVTADLHFILCDIWLIYQQHKMIGVFVSGFLHAYLELSLVLGVKYHLGCISNQMVLGCVGIA
jgi:hypothetical protein